MPKRSFWIGFALGAAFGIFAGTSTYLRENRDRNH